MSAGKKARRQLRAAAAAERAAIAARPIEPPPALVGPGDPEAIARLFAAMRGFDTQWRRERREQYRAAHLKAVS